MLGRETGRRPPTPKPPPTAPRCANGTDKREGELIWRARIALRARETPEAEP